MDIDLVDANIMWTAVGTPNHALAGQMKVEHRKEPSETSLYYRHRSKLGACMMWKNDTEQERLKELLRIAVCMMSRDGLDPSAVHKGLSVIPEYRELMAFTFDEFEDERRQDLADQ